MLTNLSTPRDDSTKVSKISLVKIKLAFCHLSERKYGFRKSFSELRNLLGPLDHKYFRLKIKSSAEDQQPVAARVLPKLTKFRRTDRSESHGDNYARAPSVSEFPSRRIKNYRNEVTSRIDLNLISRGGERAGVAPKARQGISVN